MKKISKFFALLLSIVMMLSVSMPAFADTADQATLDARNGVVKVLVYLNDYKSASRWGSGFIINENTIVTAAHLLDETSTEKVTKVTVVAVADIEIEANALVVSRERDFAVLELDQKINQRAILPLGAPQGFDTTSSVSALGFPWVKELTSSKINYSPADVVVTGGTVSSISNLDSVKYVQHSAIIDDGNSGGPLVYSDGVTATVVGINVLSVTHSDASYYYSVHIDELLEALDTLGVEYTAYSAGTAAPAPSADGNSDATEAPAAETKSNDNFFAKNKTAVIIVAAVVVALIAVLVVVLIVNKNKNSQPVPAQKAYTPAGGGRGPSTMTGGVAGSVPSGEATTLLGSDPSATTVLNAGASSAYLIRVSNNEKIPINKPLFKIGKDASRTDYCVSGNSAVSRYHAAIISRDGKYFIEDQGATNHTYVNDSMIPAKAETQLTNGAKIRLADEKFEFRI
ncbi:MAG: trypsin-like peptidase domain-containing protein [Eubacteriales bacterium]|nr:trypsin-like peptidase domain-containing protein [Eubacteriales bacterium]